MLNQNPVIDAALRGVQKAALKDTNNLSSEAVAGAHRDLATEIGKQPEIQHASNTEPWYTKRSRWASIIGLAFTVLTPLGTKFGLNLDPATQELVVTSCTTIGGLIAAYLAYRAGVATKPLGMAIILAVMVLPLAACQTIKTADEAIQSSLPEVCLGVAVSHQAFIAVAAIKPLPVKVMNAELVAYNRTLGFCADPANANTATAIVTVTLAGYEIAKALQAAEKLE